MVFTIYGGFRLKLSLKPIHWLVVLTILKNMKVNGKDDIPYINETTNQNIDE